MNELIVEKSRTKLWLMILGSLIFISLGGAMIFYAERIEISAYSLQTIQLIGLASLLFFGLVLGFLVKMVMDKKPGLILDQQGFIDYSSALAGERVAWRDVTNLGEYKIQGQRFIVVYLTDPDGFLNSFSGLKKMTMKTNEKMTGSPLNIGTSALKIPFDELMQQFYIYAENYHKNQ